MQSKESERELLCSRVSEFLPAFFPPLSTHGGNTFCLYGAVMGASNGGRGEGVLERSCLSVGGYEGLGGGEGMVWTGSDTCERLPLSGETFRRKPGAPCSQYITPK